ncbi:DUF3098 domain-containing protein [Microbacter margulisiae]|uniref:DUF3098 domain-containing protein n=1 Tax=Microbacter margulisiae TaxID=1350067 RepID=A0A7W5H3M2_9PORP|nr:DUF3098 domain-containing protein [Microbacter margulisiae]MBB3187743.1 hypothetical protein [Microbacter margulisiae]MBB3188779.1 hypothetical protein [Microbacter margulisiae]
MKQTKQPVKTDETQNQRDFALGKTNWILIGVSVFMIILGFLLMTGGKSGSVFNPDIFSTRRITVGPMISLFGFLSMFFSIMWRNKKEDENK